jgi:hypothetical protein
MARMSRRRYRRTSEAYRSLMQYIAKYQKVNGVAPTDNREIGAAVGTSHTQVSRLVLKALTKGLLKKSSPDALVYEIIRTPPTTAGLSWIARVQCSWTKGINWVRDESDGVWLDRAVYGIKSGSERFLWALTFPDSAVDRGAGFLKLSGDAMALVRHCAPDEMEYRHWYVIERRNREVIVSSLAKKVKGKWTFQVSARDEAPVTINAKEITKVSEILMVTMRPSPPTQRV